MQLGVHKNTYDACMVQGAEFKVKSSYNYTYAETTTTWELAMLTVGSEMC